MSKLRLRLFQLDIRSTISENLNLIENAARATWHPQNIDEERLAKTSDKSSQKAEGNCDVLLLPELFTTGYYTREKMEKLAETMEGNTVTTLKRIVRETGISIGCGSFVEKDGDRLYNTTFALNKKGQLINRYRKTHLFTPMNEDKIFEPGDRVHSFTCNGINIGTILCYEIRFPELTRKLALDGAKIIFCPCEWPNPKSDVLYTLSKARAIENQLYFVTINRVGIQGKYEFCGKSMVVSPNGKVLAMGSDNDEEIIDVELDLSLVEKYRNEIPALSERKPELY